MPAPRPQQRRSDIKLLLGAGVAVLLGGIVIAAAILALTARGTKAPDIKRPLPFGLAADVHQRVRAGGPVNIAGLSGDDGFWVAIEDHQLVALLVKQPVPDACTLRWRGSKDTFTCDDRPVASRTMARYRSFVQRSGPNKGAYMVALLRDVQPAPAGPPAGG